MEWVETTAESVGAAKERALDQLGVHDDEAEFEILHEAVTGLFGRVKQRARVRARVRPRTPPSKEVRRRRGSQRSSSKDAQQRPSKRNSKSGGGVRSDRGGAATDKGSRRGDRPRVTSGAESATGATGGDGSGALRPRRTSNEQRRSRRTDNQAQSNENLRMNEDIDRVASISLEDQADIAEEFVAGLAERFDASVRFSREYVEDREIRVIVSGTDLGRMVGRGGSTAHAIDDLVRTVLQRRAGSGRKGWIRVDVGGVRARRMEFLAKFCREQADAVKETGVARALESMNAADRKVVHDTISDISGVTTASEGEDPDRCVVIMPAADAD